MKGAETTVKLMSEDFHQYGFKAAMESKCNPEALKNYLDGIYGRFFPNNQLSPDATREFQEELKQQIINVKHNKEQIESGITKTQDSIEQNEKLLRSCEQEKIGPVNPKESTTQSSYISYFIGTVITILLSLYLFLFYSSTGSSALYGIEHLNDGFFNPDVISIAQNRGGSALAFVLLFPIIFLAAGFVLHIALEKNKAEKRNIKSLLTIFLILLLTLIADSIIGYKIAKGLHNLSYQEGLIDLPWTFEMIYSDINFYLVLLLGFVVYIIWGFLLNYVLSTPHSKSRKNTNENKESPDIYKVNEELSRWQTELDNAERQMVQMNHRLEQKEYLLTQIEAQNLPAFAQLSVLEEIIREFLKGYHSFLSKQPKAELIQNQIKTTSQKWLQEKQKLFINP